MDARPIMQAVSARFLVFHCNVTLLVGIIIPTLKWSLVWTFYVQMKAEEGCMYDTHPTRESRQMCADSYNLNHLNFAGISFTAFIGTLVSMYYLILFPKPVVFLTHLEEFTAIHYKSALLSACVGAIVLFKANVTGPIICQFFLIAGVEVLGHEYNKYGIEIIHQLLQYRRGDRVVRRPVGS